MSENYTKEIEDASMRFIGLNPNKKVMDREERYYNPRVKEYDAFKAGVNSKITTKIKLEFAIKQLKELKHDYNANLSISIVTKEKIEELEQQLKDLK